MLDCSLYPQCTCLLGALKGIRPGPVFNPTGMGLVPIRQARDSAGAYSNPGKEIMPGAWHRLVGRVGITKGLGKWVVAAWEVLPVGPWAYLRDGRIARTLGLRSNTTSGSDVRKALKTERLEYSQNLDRSPAWYGCPGTHSQTTLASSRFRDYTAVGASLRYSPAGSSYLG